MWWRWAAVEMAVAETAAAETVAVETAARWRCGGGSGVINTSGEVAAADVIIILEMEELVAAVEMAVQKVQPVVETAVEKVEPVEKAAGVDLVAIWAAG